MEWIDVNDELPYIGQPCLVARCESPGTVSQWWFGCCTYQDYGFPYVAQDDPNPIQYWIPIPNPPPSEDNDT